MRYFHHKDAPLLENREYYYWSIDSKGRAYVFYKNGRISESNLYSNNQILEYTTNKIWIEVPEYEAVLMR